MINRKVFNIIILGPQGSGKGTQAEVLSKKLHLEHIETGKIFRSMARRRSSLGRKIHQLINVKGRLVPSGFVVKILQQTLGKVSQKKGLIFDGYPRDLFQARALDRLLGSLGRRLTHVIYLPISRISTIRRLALRRTCGQCGRIFILGVDLKRKSKHCTVCGGQVYQREDDMPKAIAKRLDIYIKQTRPLIAYYRKRNILIIVNGEPPIAAVTKEIFRHLI